MAAVPQARSQARAGWPRSPPLCARGRSHRRAGGAGRSRPHLGVVDQS